MSGIGAWWHAIRPKTLSAAVAPVAVGAALAVPAGVFHAGVVVAALAGALLIQIGTNLSNDVLDFRRGADTGERIGPTRVVQAGLLSPTTVSLGAAAAFGLAAVIGVYLVGLGGIPILLLGIAAIASGIAYTAGPYPLAYLGLGDLFVMTFFGVAAVAGTYYIQVKASTFGLAATMGLRVMPVAVALGVAVGALSVAILTVNNLRDVDTDRTAGKRTLAVRMGPEKTRMYFDLLVWAAIAIPMLMALMPVWPAHIAGNGLDRPAALLAVGLAIPLAMGPVRRIHAGTEGAALNPVLAETARLQLAHAGLLAGALLIDALLRG